MEAQCRALAPILTIGLHLLLLGVHFRAVWPQCLVASSGVALARPQLPSGPQLVEQSGAQMRQRRVQMSSSLWQTEVASGSGEPAALLLPWLQAP